MWRCCIASASTAARLGRGALQQRRSIAESVCGVAPSVKFRRMCEAPTMEPDAMVSTLKAMVAEKSADVALLRALSRRFHARAEEFFPLQIDRLLGCFADLRYADKSLAEGLTGRIGDVMSDASPRRVVRILRNGATLRIPQEAWLDATLSQLRRHVPNLRDGIPSVLASLQALRWRDEELAELLLTQGLLISEGLDTGGRMNCDSDSYFARLFERWSRFGFRNSEAESLAVSLVKRGRESAFDLRDSLNLLAGLRRCDGVEARQAAAELETILETRLREASAADVAAALAWMESLSVCSPSLWQAAADGVELGLGDKAFLRDWLPSAMQSLAALLSSPPLRGEGHAGGAEIALLEKLFSAKELSDKLPWYSASSTLCILRAAALIVVHCRERGATEALAKIRTSVPWMLLANPMSRATRQLSLPERRVLWPVAEVLQDFHQSKSATRTDVLSELLSLSLVPLPALAEVGVASIADGVETHYPVEVGAETLLQQGPKAAVRFLNSGDRFACIGSLEDAGTELRGSLTPSGLLTLRAIELRGWEVDLHA